MNFIFQNTDDESIIELEASDINVAWSELDRRTGDRSVEYVLRDELPVFTLVSELREDTGDEYGDSYTRWIIARTRRNADHKTIGEAVVAMFPAEHCQHEYDCCGRYYPSQGTWSTTQFSDVILIKQEYHQNV